MSLPGPLILASGSPRRSQLLLEAGLNFRVIAPNTPEEWPENIAVRRIPEYLAEKKAKVVQPEAETGDIILAADTLVFLNDTLIGKPTGADDAIHILEKLSGRMHQVITGVCILHRDKIIQFSDITDVHFLSLDPGEIRYYVEHFKPFDKAGAYAIQEWIGLRGIEKITGCYYNVMGLPVSRVIRHLESL